MQMYIFVNDYNLREFMSWANDAHGLVFKSSEIKLYRNGGHTWKMKLSQIGKQTGSVYIITYSLPEIEYVQDCIAKRPSDIHIVCHSKFMERATTIKRLYPNVSVYLNAEVHSKVCLIAPSTVYIGSANFGVSHWHETIVGIRSKEALDWYLENSFFPLLNESEKL